MRSSNNKIKSERLGVWQRENHFEKCVRFFSDSSIFGVTLATLSSIFWDLRFFLGPPAAALFFSLDTRRLFTKRIETVFIISAPRDLKRRPLSPSLRVAMFAWKWKSEIWKQRNDASSTVSLDQSHQFNWNSPFADGSTSEALEITLNSNIISISTWIDVTNELFCHEFDWFYLRNNVIAFLSVRAFVVAVCMCVAFVHKIFMCLPIVWFPSLLNLQSYSVKTFHHHNHHFTSTLSKRIARNNMKWIRKFAAIVVLFHSFLSWFLCLCLHLLREYSTSSNCLVTPC